MGHYAAEMQCSKCGHLRCTCPPAPVVGYVFDENFDVKPAASVPFLVRVKTHVYASRQQALDGRADAIRAARKRATQEWAQARVRHREAIEKLDAALARGARILDGGAA